MHDSHFAALCRGDRAIVCAAHKGNSMIDVRSRQCLHMGCKRQPSFAEAGSRPEYCSSHKKDGMVDVKNRGSKKLHSFQACNKMIELHHTARN